MTVTYDKSLNPTGASLPGVPLGDMTEADFKALPVWLQTSVAACPFYTVPSALIPMLPREPGSEIEPLDTSISADMPHDDAAHQNAPPADEVNPHE